MPIIVGNRPIFRIKFQNADIREVRKGNELKWGLYRITYINKGPGDVDSGWDKGKNIPNYVWGYPAQSKKDFYFYEPDDVTAKKSKEVLGDKFGYRSHSDGWFNESGCDELYYIPAVTKNFHKDLTLFCKWRQRRYLYNGVGIYYKVEEVLTGYEWVRD